MYKIKDKETVLREYVNRYPELDQHFKDELAKEYDRYRELLDSVETKEEAIGIFNEEIRKKMKKDTKVIL